MQEVPGDIRGLKRYLVCPSCEGVGLVTVWQVPCEELKSPRYRSSFYSKYFKPLTQLYCQNCEAEFWACALPQCVECCREKLECLTHGPIARVNAFKISTIFTETH